MKFVNVNPGRRTRNHFFPTNVMTKKATPKNRPAVNIIETEDDFRIELAAPGLSKKDFQLNVENEVLTIFAKKETEKKDGEKYTRQEFSYGEFNRSFKLPESIDTEGVSARFKSGILTVVLAKKEESKPQPAKKIEIK